MKNKNKIRQCILLISGVLVFIFIFVFIHLIGYQKKDMLKVGVILTGDIEDIGWNGAHYQGVKNACERLELELIVKEHVLEGTGDCEKAVRELIDKGAEMIILSSYGYPEEVKTVVADFPEVAFYGISAEHYADNMTSYFGRMYQARYLAGVVAGMKTENNQIGYVAAMSNSEVNRGINAFTLGVKRVNPDAVVNVIWTDTWDDAEKERAAANKLITVVKVDVITYHQNQDYVARVADEAGVFSIGYNETAEGLSDNYLTAAIWNWDELYYQILREYVQGKANSVKRHWFGIGTGVIMLSDYSDLVEEEIRVLVESIRKEIYNGKDVFSGVIYDNSGMLRCGEGESISDEVLLEKMDWFVDGVVVYE